MNQFKTHRLSTTAHSKEDKNAKTETSKASTYFSYKDFLCAFNLTQFQDFLSLESISTYWRLHKNVCFWEGGRNKGTELRNL
jgi:hypothetical protein